MFTNPSAPLIPYGGQALIEGVMMKAKSHITLALRNKDNSITLVRKTVKSSVPDYIRNTPFFRGIFLLIDMMGVGMWGLNYSADHYFTEYLDDNPNTKNEKTNPVLFTITAIVSVLIAIFVFKFLPTLLMGLLTDVFDYKIDTFSKNVIEGLIRMTIFFLYVFLVGLSPEVKKVFAYHGGEHTAVNALEDNSDKFNNLDFASKFDTLHYRCGTSFIVFVILVSIIVYGLIDISLLPWAHKMNWITPDANLPPLLLRTIIRIIGIPFIVGIAFEITKNVYFLKKTIFRPVLEFGMLFQRLTTRKPSLDQLEVAIAALIDVRNQVETTSTPLLTAVSKIIDIDNPNTIIEVPVHVD